MSEARLIVDIPLKVKPALHRRIVAFEMANGLNIYTACQILIERGLVASGYSRGRAFLWKPTHSETADKESDPWVEKQIIEVWFTPESQGGVPIMERLPDGWRFGRLEKDVTPVSESIPYSSSGLKRILGNLGT